MHCNNFDQSVATPTAIASRNLRATNATTKSGETLRHPIGAVRTPAVVAIVGDVAAVLDDQQLDRTLGFTREPLCVLPRHHAILLAGNDEQRARDAVRNALEGKRRGIALGLLLGGAMAAHPE